MPRKGENIYKRKDGRWEGRYIKACLLYTSKWDSDKPNGTPRKILDVSKAKNLGWTYKTELEDGIRLAYEDFLNNPMRAER